jgi:hypothetical protein
MLELMSNPSHHHATHVHVELDTSTRPARLQPYFRDRLLEKSEIRVSTRRACVMTVKGGREPQRHDMYARYHRRLSRPNLLYTAVGLGNSQHVVSVSDVIDNV